MSAHESARPEGISEAELIELFRPRRPEPEAFGAAVRRRIQERERAAEVARESTQGADSVGNTWLRRAAAWLPFEPFTGALGGAGVGKAVGAKLLPAALALPALLLCTALGAFTAGARSLKRSAAEARPVDPSRRMQGGWGRQPTHRALRKGRNLLSLLQFGSLFIVVALPILGGTWAIDVLFVLLLVSMASLAVSMQGFARAGMLTRPEVARLCTGVLVSVFMACFLWMGAFHVPDSISELGVGWSAGVVLLAAPLCLLSTRATRASALPFVLLTPLLALLNPIGLTLSSAKSLHGQLASLELDTEDLWGWSEAAALHHALRSVGHELPGLAPLGRQVEAAIEAGTDGHPRIWTAAFDMGLIDSEHAARLAQDGYHGPRLARLCTGEGPLFLVDYDEYLFWLLREEGELSNEGREALADRLEAGWPEEGKHAALAYALLCVRGLDLIGAPERADGLRARAHSLLQAYWISGDTGFFGKPGGFTSDPLKFRTSFDDHTWFALQLMERLGVPPEIDLRLLRGHLRTESRAMLFDMAPELKAWSRAALLLLEDGIGMPPRNALQRVLDERLLVASLLIVALCLIAIRLAPSVEPDGARGALP